MRIRSELDAANLSNRALTCAGGVGSASCDATASAAAIALSRQDGLAIIRVIATLPDGYELHRLIRVPAAAGGDDPSVLAMRAVELLRDIYLDVPRDFPHREAPKPGRGAAAAGDPDGAAAGRPRGPQGAAHVPRRGGAGRAERAGPGGRARARGGASPRPRPVAGGVGVGSFRPAGRRREDRFGDDDAGACDGRRALRAGAAGRHQSVRRARHRRALHPRGRDACAGEGADRDVVERDRAAVRLRGRGVGVVPALARCDRAGRGVLHAADDGHRHQRRWSSAARAGRRCSRRSACSCRSASASSVSAISTAATPSSWRWPGRGCGGGRRCGR